LISQGPFKKLLKATVLKIRKIRWQKASELHFGSPALVKKFIFLFPFLFSSKDRIAFGIYWVSKGRHNKMDKQKTRKAAPQVMGRVAAWAAQQLNGEHQKVIITGLQRFLLCAVLARGTVLDGYAPFGLAMAAAQMAQGAGLSAIGGIFFGATLLEGGIKSGVYAAAALLVLCVMAVCAGLRILKKPWFAPMVAALSGAACTFVFLPLGPGMDMTSVLTFMAVQALTFGACRVYVTALAPPMSENDWRRPATLLVVGATLLLSFADIKIMGLFVPARVIAVLLVLASAYLGGPTAGAAAGVVFGAVMDLAAGPGAALFTCCYGLSAMVSGLFRDQGRIWFAVCAAASGLCSAMLGAENALFVPLLAEFLLGTVMFAALPGFVWDAIGRTLPKKGETSASAGRTVRQVAGKCASEAAQAFYELYISMLNGLSEGKAAGDQNIRVVFDQASEHVCKNCVLCSKCWQRDYVTTLSAFNDVTQPMLKRGKAELSDFPQHFASRCVHLPELIRSINAGLFALRERESLRRQKAENQSLLARQYAGITDILRQLGAEITHDEISQPLMEKQVKRYAAAFGWIERVCVVRDSQGRLTVELYGEGIADILKQGAGFSAGLSALLGVGLTLPKKVKDGLGERLVLRERAPFRAVVGIGRQQKEGAAVSGDSGCYFLTDEGTACLLLSDGMGSGAAAARDSRMMVTSLERFLRAGVTVSDALKAVSPALRLRSDGMRFTTLDAFTLDLFTGRAESLKCGAAPSYFRAGCQWTVLMSQSLPVGLAEEDELGEAVPLRLGHGDIYVMLSDGISDGKDDGWVRELLIKHSGEGPKELAARLVTEARSHNPDDDRTALVLRVEKT